MFEHLLQPFQSFLKCLLRWAERKSHITRKRRFAASRAIWIHIEVLARNRKHPVLECFMHKSNPIVDWKVLDATENVKRALQFLRKSNTRFSESLDRNPLLFPEHSTHDSGLLIGTCGLENFQCRALNRP